MIQSVARAVGILRCFEEQESLGITQIARAMQLNKSTAFGLAATLVELGMLEQDGTSGRYRLGLELYRLGCLVDTDIRRVVLPELTALSEQLKETMNFVRPDGGDVVYLIKKESPHSMRICTKDGQRLPMYCTAVGKAILAFLPPEEQEKILSGSSFVPCTANTVTSAGELRRSLLQIVRDGYALDREEFEYGLVCVALPILDQQGRPVAAISCSGPTSRMDAQKIEECLEAMRHSLQRLSRTFF